MPALHEASTTTDPVSPFCVLVVDDEPSICWAFDRMLREEGHQVVTAPSAEEGLRLAARHRPDLVLLDVRLPKEDGITALPKFIDSAAGPVVVMTAFGDLDTAVAAVNGGASEYMVKPFALDEARRVCRNALRSRRKAGQNVSADVPANGEEHLVGTSSAMQQVFRQIALVAGSDLSVLITGETGTGKELVAAAVHRHSRRSAEPYLPIAPVALNSDLIESELFGHVQGAFTGAITDRAGLFERAEGGTVLLDEIGDLPLAVQVKLLRVLEQGEFTRVGEVTPRKCNARILAATNCDLHRAVGEGHFREDLFYRLNGLHIHLPPLRQRTEDIAPLCQHFLTQIGYQSQEVDARMPWVTQLARRPWFGNIRELRNAVHHAAVVARGRPLTIDDFPPPQPGRQAEGASGESAASDLQHAIGQWVRQRLADEGEEGNEEGTNESVGYLHEHLLAAAEPTLFRLTLEHTGGNRAKAAELLGIHRGTLREKLRGYGLDET